MHLYNAVHFTNQVGAIDLTLPAVIAARVTMAIPETVVGEVKALIHSATESGMAKAVHGASRVLETAGFFYKLKIHSRHVGCHPQNRDGSGINSVDVHELLDDVLTTGFVLDRVNAVGVEVSSDNELQWNERLVKSANGALGTMDTSQLKVLSLSGSHTNFVRRILDQEAAHNTSEMVTSNGQLSKEMLKRVDPNFHQAVEEGYEWKVLAKAVTLQIPELLGLVQRMGNANLNRAEHELQLLRRLHSIHVNQQSMGLPVDYQRVRKLAGQGVSGPIVKSMPHLYSFMLKAGGGVTPWLLIETENFVRTNTPSTKILGPEIWAALSVDVKGPSQFIRFRHAMVTRHMLNVDVNILYITCSNKYIYIYLYSLHYDLQSKPR